MEPAVGQRWRASAGFDYDVISRHPDGKRLLVRATDDGYEGAWLPRIIAGDAYLGPSPSPTQAPTPAAASPQARAGADRSGCKAWCGHHSRQDVYREAPEFVGDGAWADESAPYDDGEGFRWCSAQCRDERRPPIDSTSTRLPADCLHPDWCRKSYDSPEVKAGIGRGDEGWGNEQIGRWCYGATCTVESIALRKSLDKDSKFSPEGRAHHDRPSGNDHAPAVGEKPALSDLATDAPAELITARQPCGYDSEPAGGKKPALSSASPANVGIDHGVDGGSVTSLQVMEGGRFVEVHPDRLLSSEAWSWRVSALLRIRENGKKHEVRPFVPSVDDYDLFGKDVRR